MTIVELLKATREAAEMGGFRNASAEFLVLMFRAQAEATVEFIGAHRELEAESRELGFQARLAGSHRGLNHPSAFHE